MRLHYLVWLLVKSAATLFKDMLPHVFRAPMSYFETVSFRFRTLRACQALPLRITGVLCVLWYTADTHWAPGRPLVSRRGNDRHHPCLSHELVFGQLFLCVATATQP